MSAISLSQTASATRGMAPVSLGLWRLNWTTTHAINIRYNGNFVEDIFSNVKQFERLSPPAVKDCTPLDGTFEDGSKTITQMSVASNSSEATLLKGSLRAYAQGICSRVSSRENHLANIGSPAPYTSHPPKTT